MVSWWHQGDARLGFGVGAAWASTAITVGMFFKSLGDVMIASGNGDQSAFNTSAPLLIIAALGIWNGLAPSILNMWPWGKKPVPPVLPIPQPEPIPPPAPLPIPGRSQADYQRLWKATDKIEAAKKGDDTPTEVR